MAEKVHRKRGWFLQRSWEYDRKDPTSPYHGASEQEWRDGVLAEWTSLAQDKKVDFCHFIFHDRDEVLDANGTSSIKPIHAHAVVRYADARTQSAVMKDFCGSNQRVENCQGVDPQKGGFRTALLYLTHHTTDAYNKGKTWYMHYDVHQFGKPYLELIKTDKRDRKNARDIEATVEELVNKIGDGELTMRAAKDKFRELEGFSALNKYKHVFDSALDTYKETLTSRFEYESHVGLFHKRTTYISGPSQTGKSALASSMAVYQVGADNVFTVAGGNSRKITTDFVDGYEMQKATIFNDMEPDEYHHRSFYNMFDPEKWMLSKSRNNVKLWFSTYCYIATALPIGEFIIRMINASESYILDVKLENASLLRQSFRRVQQVLNYGVDASGNAVLWVIKIKDKLPSDEEIVKHFKDKRMYCFDSSVSSLIYDVLGYIPYDKDITASKPFHDERMRMAEIADAVFAGDLNVSGFVRM